MDGGHNVGHERYEAEIFAGCLAGGEEEGAGIGAEAPVVMLARAVDAREWFFVEEHAEVMALCDFRHYAHKQQVVVVGQVTFLEYRSQFELVGRYLVVACVGRDSEAVAFQLKVEHESLYAGGDGAEVVVLELLVFGALVTHKCAAGHYQVGTGGIQGLVDEEVLLLPSEEAVYMVDLLVEVSRDAGSGFVDRVEGAEKRGLEVERLAGIGDEDGRDTESLVEDEHRGGDVPGRVSAGLERVSYAAVGEAGSVRLLLHEEFAGKFLDYAPLAVVLDKGVVFLGCASSQGREPVGVVAHSVVKRPLLHPGCHAVGEL